MVSYDFIEYILISSLYINTPKIAAYKYIISCELYVFHFIIISYCQEYWAKPYNNHILDAELLEW